MFLSDAVAIIILTVGRSRKIAGGNGWTLIEPCPRCGRLPGQCICDNLDEGGLKTAKLRLEKRKGKPTTVLYDLAGITNLKDLSRALKNLVSAGGTVKADTIEIQGEHRERFRSFLQKQGFRVKG